MNEKNNDALICAKNDLQSINNMVGEKKAMRFLSIIKPELELMTGEQYQKIRQGLFMLASNDLYPIKGRSIAFFIKYGNHAEIQLGYQAFIELASRNDILINVQAVCKGDEFQFNRATSEVMHFSGLDRNELETDNIEGIYATCLFKGQRITEFMTMSEIQSHKNRYSKKDGKGSFSKAWVNSFAEMGKKTVIIKLCKRLPLISEKMQEVINFENESNFDVKKEEKIIDIEKVKKATAQFSNTKQNDNSDYSVKVNEPNELGIGTVEVSFKDDLEDDESKLFEAIDGGSQWD